MNENISIDWPLKDDEYEDSNFTDNLMGQFHSYMIARNFGRIANVNSALRQIVNYAGRYTSTTAI